MDQCRPRFLISLTIKISFSWKFLWNIDFKARLPLTKGDIYISALKNLATVLLESNHALNTVH